MGSHTIASATVVRMVFGGSVLAVLAAVTTMLSGFGTQSEWWDFRVGFMVLKWGAYSAAVAGILCFGGGMWASMSGHYHSAFVAAACLLLSMIVMGIPWSWKHTVSQVPPIHDISTDMVVPPEFVRILPLRKNAPNPATYGGLEIASQQREAYPDLTSLVLDRPTDHVFVQALDVIDHIGWELVDASPTEGRIEAVDTTFWFGFKDDVVIRVLPSKAGSKVDVRSVSRVGRSDVGSNARRIRTFLASMNAQE